MNATENFEIPNLKLNRTTQESCYSFLPIPPSKKERL